MTDVRDSGLSLQDAWQRRGPLATALLPLAAVFAALSALRRTLYRFGILRTVRLSRPVIVVGNITAGGSGKTPLTLWLARQLEQRGWHPGIVSRGHGGSLRRAEVREVRAGDLAYEVGDEPLLLKYRAGVPVFVGRDRVAAARALLGAHPQCDVIISDDGLQHYHMGRDVEIAILDDRALMNGWPLPAGPLREPVERLRRVDALVLNGKAEFVGGDVSTFRMEMVGTAFTALNDPTNRCSASALTGLKLAAVAGIGVPQRFFDHLTALGLHFVPHVFPDHHRYQARDLAAVNADALLMTEKDAVKCAGLTSRPVWVMPVTAQVTSLQAGTDLVTHVEQRIMEKLHGRPPA